MGWLFKGFLVLVAFALIGAGVWELGAIIFVYLLFSLRGGRRKFQRVVVVSQPTGGNGDSRAVEGGPRRSRLGIKWHWRYLLGVVFLVAVFLAVGAQGTWSPVVFGSLAGLCFLWGPISRSGRIPSAGFSPLGESTLLRSAIVPFEWLTVVELKLSSQESSRALSVLHDNLVVVAPPSEKPSAYLMVKETALGYRSAEERVSEKLKKLAGVFASRGVFLLPLDSLEVSGLFRPGLQPLRMQLDQDGALAAVAHAPYDVLVAKSLGGYLVEPTNKDGEVERVFAGQTGPAKEADLQPAGRAIVPGARDSFEKPALLWEVVSCLLERFRFSEPDACTMFLNNMHLSRGVPPGVKMSLAGGAGERPNGSTLTVESLGGAPVELTRAQLRMIVKMYD